MLLALFTRVEKILGIGDFEVALFFSIFSSKLLFSLFLKGFIFAAWPLSFIEFDKKMFIFSG